MTALGPAFPAGQAVGFWNGVAELEKFWQVDQRFEPQMSADQRETLHAGWKKAVKKARD